MKRLYIGNLSYNATEEDLRQTFSAVGTVVDAKIVMDRESGRPRGFAFVEMSTDEEGAKAIEFDGCLIQGRPISVKEANERGGGGGGGGGGGYRARPPGGAAPSGGGGWQGGQGGGPPAGDQGGGGGGRRDRRGGGRGGREDW